MTHEDELIYDWNRAESMVATLPGRVQLLDDTLRDGLQNASVRQPSTAERVELLHLMVEVGVSAANLGLPAAGPRAFEECLALCREVERAKLPIAVACAGRTLESDLRPIIELSQRTGVELEAHTFIGSSPIRAYAEGWDTEFVKRRSESAIRLLVDAGLEVTFVTEDTTRSRPEQLSELWKLALGAGAERLCLCDTVGHATPQGTKNLIAFARRVVAEQGGRTKIDWHGHNDRGLALANALAAMEAGVDRVHATALGIGERVGNTPLELLALNLVLSGSFQGNAHRLAAYAVRAAQVLGWQIPPNYPLIGANAFRTATGVHAAAIAKAQGKNGALADRVYSGVPADLFGLEQQICVGAMSGRSNVEHWLRSHGLAPSEKLLRAILDHAKTADHILSDEELLSVVRQSQ
ncbi:MAG TPA: 2-isopropylmalate synthase [Polyangiaceae bacterium]|nr:2-isopropylmalate synthase [Polyangiaceae bacterium]